MRRRVRPTTSLTLLMLLALPFSMLSGCSDGAGAYGTQSKPQLVLGFSQVVAKANWNTANSESIRKAAHDAGIELRLEDAERSREKQVAALRSFVTQRVDVIAFSPVIETGWEVVLREIRSAGIPVVLLDRTIDVNDDSLYVSLIGSDF